MSPGCLCTVTMSSNAVDCDSDPCHSFKLLTGCHCVRLILLQNVIISSTLRVDYDSTSQYLINVVWKTFLRQLTPNQYIIIMMSDLIWFRWQISIYVIFIFIFLQGSQTERYSGVILWDEWRMHSTLRGQLKVSPRWTSTVFCTARNMYDWSCWMSLVLFLLS